MKKIVTEIVATNSIASHHLNGEACNGNARANL